MIAGTFPERYRNKHKTGDECFESFREDFLKNAMANMEFLAAMNQERRRKEDIAKAERQTVV